MQPDPRHPHAPPRPQAVQLDVGRGTVLTRGWKLRCPNCGAKSLFESYFKPAEHCVGCGLKFERDEGFFLGALVISYAVTCLAGPVPALVLWLLGWWPDWLAWSWAAVTAIALPIAFFPVSRSWNLALYYAVLPDHLPANGQQDRVNAVSDSRG